MRVYLALAFAAMTAGAADFSLAPGEPLEKARDEVRQWRRANPARRNETLRIVLAAGRYERTESLRLGPEDSNVEWSAAPGAEVVITGARRLGGGRLVSHGPFVARLPEAAKAHATEFDLTDIPAGGDPRYDGDHDLQQRINCAYEQAEAAIGSVEAPRDDPGEMDVFADGKALRLARSPEDRLFRIAVPEGMKTHLFLGRTNWVNAVVATKDDWVKRWDGEPEPYVCGNWGCDWVEQRHHVDRFDPATRTLTLSAPNILWGYTLNQWFYGFNLICELDRPGEWVCDKAAKRLVAWLPEGAKTVEVSVARRLVEMVAATNVTFRGLTFSQSRNTAVTMDGCVACRIAGCDVKGAGGYGVIVRDGSGCGVSGGEFTDLGGGGVALVDGNRRTLVASGHFVEDATIHAIGRRYRMYRPAIWLVGVGSRASFNHIYDAPHSAILFFGNDLTIEGNDVHEVCKEANDCGVFYTGRSGLLRGNVIRGNYIHQILGFGGRFCRTIYLDDGFAAAEICGNVFWQVPWAVFIGGAQDNLIHDNVFVDCAQAVFIDDRGTGWMKGHIDRRLDEFRKSGTNRGCRIDRPPYSTKYPELLEAYTKKDLHQPFGNRLERNVFWQGGGSFIRKATGKEPAADWWLAKSLNGSSPDILCVTNNLVDVQQQPLPPIGQRRFGPRRK